MLQENGFTEKVGDTHLEQTLVSNLGSVFLLHSLQPLALFNINFIPSFLEFMYFILCKCST